MGAAHLRTVFLTQTHDQNPRISHNRVEGAPSPSGRAEAGGHKRSAEGYSAWGCSCREWGCERRQTRRLTVLAGNPGPLDKILSGTADRPLFGRVFVDTLDLYACGLTR